MDQSNRSQRLIQDAHQRKIDLVEVELDLARTFVRVAVDSSDPEKISRNLGEARTAYDAVAYFLPTADLDPAERQSLDEEIASALIQLGDTFTD
jgi:hypothetical protein